MLSTIKGRVVRLAFDDVNTDVIAPGEHRKKVDDDDRDLSTLRPHVFEAIRPSLDAHVERGDIFVVGRNFGCGSHREPAVHIFKVWGVQAVITESAARIWFRNAIAAGLPVFELPRALKHFDEGDTAEIDLLNWSIRNASRSDSSYSIPPYPPTVSKILEAGGILNLLRQRVEEQFTPVTGLPE